MIDTDKYEEHTVSRTDKLGTFKGTEMFVWDWFAQQLPVWASKADVRLVQDAPLLLEEVKRLNRVITMLKKNDLWVSQEGWEESDKDDELIVSMDYLIQESVRMKEATE